jgi:alpha-galactosidase
MKTLALLATSVLLNAASADTIPLTDLDLTRLTQGWGTPQTDRSIEAKPMSVAGRAFERGLGSHAPSVLWIDVNGATRFRSWVGLDDETDGRGSITFKVYADAEPIFDSGVMRHADPARRIDLDLTGVTNLVLITTDAGDGRDYDHADWGEAEFEFEGEPPAASSPAAEETVILTPPPPPQPRINAPPVFAVRPGSPFLFRIPCTGERPIAFEADQLPEGLELDPLTGIIAGVIKDRTRCTHEVTLRAVNRHAETERRFRIVVGDTLALTPPMGWNSWYIHYNRVTDADMRAAADVMIDSGMADFGYSYVNIDDCWMVSPISSSTELGGDARNPDGTIRANARFPDMKGLADYIHSKGLKAGLYTSPGPMTCAGFEGAHDHEEIDARTFAEWGYDFLKYDWCSYGQVATGEGRERLIAPYRKMHDILLTLDRDIVHNLCQYGMGNVWEWGAEVGHCWRTTGDLGHQETFIPIGLANAQHWEHARPGAWNDPDYILIGWVGDAHRMGEGIPTHLTPSEQYTYMTMWSLMAAPLIFSGDMARLDPFTLNILCNHEVIAVNQDTLGRQARIVRQSDDHLILAKPLEDGSTAIGLFNLAEIPLRVGVTWEELDLAEAQHLRDPWPQQDLGVHEDGFEDLLNRHASRMLILRPVTGSTRPPETDAD